MVEFSRLILELAEIPFERRLATDGDLEIIADAGENPADLGIDLATQIGELGPHSQQCGMAVAIIGAQFGGAAAHLGVLGAQIGDHRRLQAFAQRSGISGGGR